MLDHTNFAVALLDNVKTLWNLTGLQDLLTHLKSLAFELVRDGQHGEKFDTLEDTDHFNEIQSFLHLPLLLVSCQYIQLMLVDRKD